MDPVALLLVEGGEGVEEDDGAVGGLKGAGGVGGSGEGVVGHGGHWGGGVGCVWGKGLWDWTGQREGQMGDVERTAGWSEGGHLCCLFESRP